MTHSRWRSCPRGARGTIADAIAARVHVSRRSAARWPQMSCTALRASSSDDAASRDRKRSSNNCSERFIAAPRVKAARRIDYRETRKARKRGSSGPWNSLRGDSVVSRSGSDVQRQAGSEAGRRTAATQRTLTSPYDRRRFVDTSGDAWQSRVSVSEDSIV